MVSLPYYESEWIDEFECAKPVFPNGKKLWLSKGENIIFKVEKPYWFSQEARIHRELSRLEEPFVPLLYEDFKYGGNVVFAFERMEGNLGELRRVFTKEMIEQQIKLIEKLHNCGIVHNDTSMANFLYNKNGKIFITDFGVSVKWDKEKHNIDTWNVHKMLDYYMLFDHLHFLPKQLWPMVEECFANVWCKKEWKFNEGIETLFGIEKWPANFHSRYANIKGFDMKAIRKIEKLISFQLEA